MCGRFALQVDATRLKEEFPWIEFPDDLGSSYNIAPTQKVAAVTNTGKPRVEFLHWGLIPFWAKDRSISNKLINARGETLAEKPSFKHAYKKRRCILFASGYFEWQKIKGEKQPVFIKLKGKSYFPFAGLWEQWKDKQSSSEEVVKSCTIITVSANESLKKYHHRMPVILKDKDINAWLAPEDRKPEELNYLLKAYDNDAFEVFPVSQQVNSPANNEPDLIKPATLF